MPNALAVGRYSSENRSARDGNARTGGLGMKRSAWGYVAVTALFAAFWAWVFSPGIAVWLANR